MRLRLIPLDSKVYLHSPDWGRCRAICVYSKYSDQRGNTIYASLHRTYNKNYLLVRLELSMKKSSSPPLLIPHNFQVNTPATTTPFRERMALYPYRPSMLWQVSSMIPHGNDNHLHFSSYRWENWGSIWLNNFPKITISKRKSQIFYIFIYL